VFNLKKCTNEYVTLDNYSILIIDSETNGKFEFLIDTNRVDDIKQFKWSVSKCTNKKTSSHINYYATTTIRYRDENNKPKQKGIQLHRFIMNAPKGMIVDHVNGNTLDTREENLRVCTFSQNKMHGVNMYSNNTSGFVGVTWVERQSQWMAYTKVNNKFINLGYYDFIEDAVEARLKGEEKYHKEFANEINRNII
jgi:hypothetical protein